MLCPVCENESENTQQCQNCGWQFVYFTEEPSEQEQNEFTLLLQNYRTEFWFNLAQQYYQNKQYEETIECCQISCEYQSFENSLGLMAASYKELGNDEEALKYTNMVLEINPQNELALLFLELNFKPEEVKEIIKLTPTLLKKDMFETTEEWENRILNLSYITIGTVSFSNYEADKQDLTFKIFLYNNTNIVFSPLISMDKYTMKLSATKAKEVKTAGILDLVVKIKNIKYYKNSCHVIEIEDISFDKYCIFNIFAEIEKNKLEKVQYDKLAQLQEATRLKKIDEGKVKSLKKENSLVSKFNKNLKAYISDRI